MRFKRKEALHGCHPGISERQQDAASDCAEVLGPVECQGCLKQRGILEGDYFEPFQGFGGRRGEHLPVCAERSKGQAGHNPVGTGV